MEFSSSFSSLFLNQALAMDPPPTAAPVCMYLTVVVAFCKGFSFLNGSNWGRVMALPRRVLRSLMISNSGPSSLLSIPGYPCINMINRRRGMHRQMKSTPLTVGRPFWRDIERALHHGSNHIHQWVADAHIFLYDS